MLQTTPNIWLKTIAIYLLMILWSGTLGLAGGSSVISLGVTHVVSLNWELFGLEGLSGEFM